ncbi:MAG: Uncharacterized protein AUREO_038210 [Aureobasidium pullulans]|nr:MAG: Uncharacterized protein AUREO_038210 [Aureobasidium pullulans]
MGSSRFFPVLIFLVTLILGISASPVLTERATTPKCTANDIALVRRTVNDEVYFCKWWLSDGRTRSPFYQFTPIQVTNLCRCIVAGSKTASKPKRDEVSAPVENIMKRQTLASCRAEVSRQFTMPWYFCTFYNAHSRTTSPFARYSAKALTTLCKCVEEGFHFNQEDFQLDQEDLYLVQSIDSDQKDFVVLHNQAIFICQDVFVFEEFIEVFKLVAVKDILKDVLQDIFANIVKVFDQNLIFIQNHVEIFLQAPDNFVFVQNLFEDNLKVFVYVIDAQDFKHVEQNATESSTSVTVSASTSTSGTSSFSGSSGASETETTFSPSTNVNVLTTSTTGRPNGPSFSIYVPETPTTSASRSSSSSAVDDNTSTSFVDSSSSGSQTNTQTVSDTVSSSAISATASTTSEASTTASSVSSNAGSTSSSAASETDSGSSAISMSSSSSISSAELAITGTSSTIDVSVTSTDSATATDSAATSSATSTVVDDISFLVQRGVKYSGTPLTGLTKRRVANDLITCLSTCAGSSACAATSFNLENLSCDYFSAIDQSSISTDAAMIFAIATSRVAVQSSSSISSESSVISGSSSMASSTSGTGSTTSDASTSSESTPAPSYTDETGASATQSSSAASTTGSTNYQSDSSSSASSTSTDASSTGDGDINTSSATQSESTSSASITETASVAADDSATSLSSASTSLTSSTSGSEEPQTTATQSSTESAIATASPVAGFQNVRILATGSGTTVDGTALQMRNSVFGFGLGGDDFKLTIDKFGNLKDSAGRFQAIKLNSRFLPYWTQSGPLVSQQNWGAPGYATISNCGVGLDMIITCRLAVPYGTHSMTFFLIRRPQGLELYAGRNDGSHRDVRLQIDVSRPSSTPSTVSTSTSSSAGISVTSSSSELGSMTSSASSVDGESMVTSASSSDESGSATISSDQGSATFSPTVTDPATSSADSASSSSEVSSTSTSVSETISTTDSSTTSEQVTATSSSVGSSITSSSTAAATPTCGTVVPYSWPGSASDPSNACRSTYTDVSSNINSYNIKCNIDYNGADILITRGSDLLACIELCSATNDCTALVFNPANGNSCYIKNTVNPSSEDGFSGLSGSEFGIMFYSALKLKDCKTPSAPDASPYVDGSTPSVGGATFGIEINTDYEGTILSVSKKRTAVVIDDCLNACAQNSACVGTAFHGSVCTLYSFINKDKRSIALGTTFATIQARANAASSSSDVLTSTAGSMTTESGSTTTGASSSSGSDTATSTSSETFSSSATSDSSSSSTSLETSASSTSSEVTGTSTSSEATSTSTSSDATSTSTSSDASSSSTSSESTASSASSDSTSSSTFSATTFSTSIISSPTPSGTASSSTPSSTPAGPTLPPVPIPTPIYVTPRSGSRLYVSGGTFNGNSIRGFSDGQNEYTGVDYDWTSIGGPSELRFVLNSTGSILLGSSGNVLCYSGKVTGNSYVELSSRTVAYFKSSAAKTDTDQWTPLPCSISGNGKLSCTATVNGVSFPQFAALSTHKLIPKSSNKLRLYKSGVTFTASTGATVNMYAAA